MLDSPSFLNRVSIEPTPSQNSASFDPFAYFRDRFFSEEPPLKTGSKYPNTGDYDWEFWGKVVSDFDQVALKHPKTLTRKIQQNGIPPALRGAAHVSNLIQEWFGCFCARARIPL